jgi:hypothetical protein
MWSNFFSANKDSFFRRPVAAVPNQIRAKSSKLENLSILFRFTPALINEL